jgi:hypothetical protein
MDAPLANKKARGYGPGRARAGSFSHALAPGVKVGAAARRVTAPGDQGVTGVSGATQLSVTGDWLALPGHVLTSVSVATGHA